MKPYKLARVHENELNVTLPYGKINTFAITSAQLFYLLSNVEMKRTHPDYLERNN